MLGVLWWLHGPLDRTPGKREAERSSLVGCNTSITCHISSQDLKNQAAVEEDTLCHCGGGALAPRSPLFHGRGAGEEETATRSRWHWALWQVGGYARPGIAWVGCHSPHFSLPRAVGVFWGFAVSMQEHVDRTGDNVPTDFIRSAVALRARASTPDIEKLPCSTLPTMQGDLVFQLYWLGPG